ncbi:MAG: hypothetical protein ACRD0W_07835 [Acidimicrobiales bacterium]
MASAGATTGTRAVVVNVAAGASAGLVAGIPLGIIMQATDIMPMVGDLISDPSNGLGWLVHLFNSALFGAIFALLFSRWISKPYRAIGLGLLYGIAWWVVGALWIMPAWLGMSEMIFEVGTNQWWSLLGHVLYGLLLGTLYALIRPLLARR